MDLLKKAEQKRKRFIARLKHSKNIICSDRPEANLILCNAGQATGLGKERILNYLSNLTDLPIPNYITEKGETYSYLAFNCTENAVKLYETCNGVLKLSQNDTNKELIIYLAYVDSVPNNETIYSNKDPVGLHILQDFLTLEEETLLMDTFNIETDMEQTLKNRQVKHYGYEFRYGSNDVDLNSPLEEKIPECCNFIWDRLKDSDIELQSRPDQLTVNKYMPGHGIPSHVDKHSPFGDMILSLSLGSDVIMDWKHSGGQYVPIFVPARSMLVMTGEARYDWQHGIQSRNWDPILEERTSSSGTIKVMTNNSRRRDVRLSLTFRWTRTGRCQCVYKTLCDNSNELKENIEGETASQLEELHVHQVYDKIASHFSITRHKPWPKVVEFMKNVPSGSIVLDLGCGNGKNILNRCDILQLAGERSNGLLEECKNYIKEIGNADCVRLDLLNAAFKDECADYIICIAVIHHFSSKIRRIQAISTIARLLRKGGKALVTVWAKDQSKSNYLDKSKDSENRDCNRLTVAGLNLPVHENRTQFQHNDLLVPWKLKNLNNNNVSNKIETTLLRYYHVFEEDELDSLCSSVASLKNINTFYEEGNWCVVFEKI